MKYYACLFCSQPVRRSNDDGPAEWVHADGSIECRPTVATPEFERPRPDPFAP